jgi:hypothetical protein
MAFLNIVNEWLEKNYGSSEVVQNAINKADAPMLSGTSGMFNAIYGRMAFTQFNNEAVAWNLLPKKAWDKSGWRIRTARGFTLATGGVADGGSVAETIKSTIVEVSTLPKLSQTVFEIGVMVDSLNGDDRYTFEEEAKAKAEDHIMDIDAQLLARVSTATAGNNFESIDRVCASNSEVTGNSYTANYADIYSLDRDSVTTYDAYVDHASGVDRDLTNDMMRNAIFTIKANSGKMPNVVLTGYDTMQRIISLNESQARYMVLTETSVKLGIDGIGAQGGQSVGLPVKAYLGIPILQDTNVVKDTISRIYFLNTDTIFIGIAKPTSMTVSDNWLDRAKYTKKAVYLTIGELICTQFSANGKIMDLK